MKYLMKKHMVSSVILGVVGMGALGLPGCSEESVEPALVVVRGPDGSPARSVVVLDAAGSATTFITVLEPVDGTRVKLDELDEVTFRWKSVPGARRYMFVANNEIGESIWRRIVPDTFLTLPEKVSGTLSPGERLKWIVQVAGESASSDINRVELLR